MVIKMKTFEIEITRTFTKKGYITVRAEDIEQACGKVYAKQDELLEVGVSIYKKCTDITTTINEQLTNVQLIK
jgi:hypothetical protein